MSNALRKVTMELPIELIESAQKNTGEGLTQTVRRGLELLASQNAYDGLRKSRGKLDLKLNLSGLRKDRR